MRRTGGLAEGSGAENEEQSLSCYADCAIEFLV